jgi:uncharacterized protein YqgV (UPF0045/DUF77 family)
VSQYRYEIRLKGRLTRPLAAEFEQQQLKTAVAPVETVVEGPLDDAALHGLLRRIEALGLELVEVRRVDDVRAPI